MRSCVLWVALLFLFASSDYALMQVSFSAYFQDGLI